MENKPKEFWISCVGDIADGSDRFVTAGPWQLTNPLKPIQVIEKSAYDKLQSRIEKCEGLLRNCKEPALDAGYGLTYKHILEYFAEVGSE